MHGAAATRPELSAYERALPPRVKHQGDEAPHVDRVDCIHTAAEYAINQSRAIRQMLGRSRAAGKIGSRCLVHEQGLPG